MENKKRVYTFGNGQAEGKSGMKNLLGGKGANLAEMNLIGVPVPPGFTITTEACIEYYQLGEQKLKEVLTEEVKAGVKLIEGIMNAGFGSSDNPLLVSVRSGARVSMPGMMDTVLNLGLNDTTVAALANRSGNERFAWDSYRRFVQMYGDVVMGMKPENKDDVDPFEEIIEDIKHQRGVELDTQLTTDDLKELVRRFKERVINATGKQFPDSPWDQLWGAIWAVFGSWNNDRAKTYRKMNDFSDDWGTAVNVQAMVFGNMGDTSATGVAFTRDAGTGENLFNGEYLINAQGEDVVAGIRTPQEITLEGSRRWATGASVSEQDRAAKFPSLQETMPELFRQLNEVQHKLELHYNDMQDLEFTIQDGKLWLLQTRNGKRTGTAMVRIAMEMLAEGRITEQEAIKRVDPQKLDELLHPVFDPQALAQATPIAKGLPASPGAASGRIVFFADEAAEWVERNEQVILARIETSPEDLVGMNAAKGIVTARGGMTSHAAVVARGMGKCCISGIAELSIDYKNRKMTIGGTVYKEGDWISLNGSTGQVYAGKLPTLAASLSGDFKKLMDLCDKYTRMYVRTNADSPHDSKVAREFGAQGIGLCRTEHMFFNDDRIKAVREMIMASNTPDREKALAKLLPMQREDFEGIFEAMNGLPVTVRLLDPPLHEFLPHDLENQQIMANELGLSVDQVKEKVEFLGEVNPMLGHRGCRLGNTYPEITRMQTRAIIEAALNVKQKGIDAKPEIMIPLIGTEQEFVMQEEIVRDTARRVFVERGDRIDYLVGTMIEIPRAALMADKVAHHAEFFSFGTNDLTQMTFGYSRDDIGKFLPIYLEKHLLEKDPFQVLDQAGVGQLVELGTTRGRQSRPDLKVGICGEHGGEPSSVAFCHRIGMNYVSCSPFRVPIARLAAAQAALED